MTPQILCLDISGNPFRWLNLQSAVYRVATGKVAWSLGDENAIVARGGVQKNGTSSEILVPPIIALARSEPMARHLGDIPLGRGNYQLFKRDRMCAYCGSTKRLTRDHIVPKSKGGLDTFENCCAACSTCNSLKADKSLEEAGMTLLFTPYVPNRAESFILSGRNILSDQMEFLMSRVSKASRLN